MNTNFKNNIALYGLSILLILLLFSISEFFKNFDMNLFYALAANENGHTKIKGSFLQEGCIDTYCYDVYKIREYNVKLIADGINKHNNKISIFDKGFMYVNHDDKISVIDTLTNKVVNYMRIPSDNYSKAFEFDPTHYTAFDTKHKRVYVTNVEFNSVFVIDTVTNNVLDLSIPVGLQPEGIAFDPKHDRMYVANAWNNTVSVIDTGTNKVVYNIKVDGLPCGVSFDPKHDRMYVANDLGTIYVIDTNTNKVIGDP
ncbi:MAG: hypothetical protein DA328_08220, partial [Nitrososphaeraceae archaeon]|nr:hypothetical protein [Nitrososphaeraceae archaeon]